MKGRLLLGRGNMVFEEPVGFPGSVIIRGVLDKPYMLRLAKSVGLAAGRGGKLIRVELKDNECTHKKGNKILAGKDIALMDFASQRSFFRKMLKGFTGVDIPRGNAGKGKSSVLLFRNIMSSHDKENGSMWYSPGTFQLMSALKMNGIDFCISDSKISLGNGFITDKDKLEGILSDNEVNIVAITLCEGYLEKVAELVRFIKSRSRAFILLGGPMPTLTPEHALVHIPEANMIVRGEGEEILPKIAEILGDLSAGEELGEDVLAKLSSLRGTVFWNRNSLVCCSLDAVNEADFNKNRPDFSILQKEDVNNGIVLFTSRGCRNNCIFCTTPGRGRFRARDSALVRKDLDSYANRLAELFPEGIPEQARAVSFNDDDFFSDPERAAGIMDHFRQMPLSIGFIQAGIKSFFGREGKELNSIIINSLSKDVFYRPEGKKTDIYIGTESLSNEELRHLRKGYTFGQIKKVVKALSERSIYQSHHIMLSNPWTRLRDMKESLDRTIKLGNEHGEFFSVLEPPITNMVSLYPSDSYEKLVREGMDKQLSIRKILRMHGFPEYDYPVVEKDIPCDRDAVLFLESLLGKIKEGKPLMEAIMEKAGYLPERMFIESLVRKSAEDVASGATSEAIKAIPQELRKEPSEELKKMNEISSGRPPLMVLDDCLFYLTYKKEKLLLEGCNREQAELLQGIVSDNAGYQCLIEDMVRREKGLVSDKETDRIYPSPDRLVVMATHNCQLRCKYCSVRKFPARMEKETLFKAIELLFTSAKKDLQLQFFGGEPLIEFGLIKEGVEYAKEMMKRHGKNVKFMLTTNGILLTPDRIEYLKREGFIVEFSIDGDAETQLRTRKAADGRDYYSLVEQNLSNAVKAGLDFYTITVVTPDTVSMLFRNFLHLVSGGHKRLQINYSLGIFWGAEDIKKLLDEFGKIMDFLKSGDGEGIEFINLTRIRKEPVVLNAEVTVDCDGTVYMETGICLEEDFNEMKRKFSVGMLRTIKDIRKVTSTRFRTLYLLSDIYGKHAEHFRKIIINNIELGNLVDRYVRYYRTRSDLNKIENMEPKELEFTDSGGLRQEELDRKMLDVLERAERISFTDKEESERLYRLADAYYDWLAKNPSMFPKTGRNNIQIMITRKCQLRCSYCPVDKNETEMSLSMAKRCVDMMLNNNLPEVRIDFLGGEPMLCFDKVKKVVNYADGLAKKKGKKVSFFMITNVIGLTPEIYDFISKRDFLLELSLDGDEETHNAFKIPHVKGLNPYRTTTMNIKKVFAGRIKNYGIMVVMPETVDRMVNNFDHVVGMGFRNIHINYAFGVFWKRQELKMFFNMLDMIMRKYSKEIASGEISIGNMTTRKEPAMLNSEIMVDTDGTIHLLSEWIFEKSFHKDRNIPIGHINTVNSFSDIKFSDFTSYYILSRKYTRGDPELRRIVLNNIEVGRMFRDYFEKWKVSG